MNQPSLFDALPDPAADPPPPDQAVRDFAVDPRHHVVLEASAGTGKTRVLVERYVRLVEAGVDPRHILAMTFTRKAATEMRERILAELERRAGLEPRAAERWAALHDRLVDVNILTIDAFCFGLLREFPLEADVDPSFDIADETDVPRFAREAIDLTLRVTRGLIVDDENVRLLFAKVRLRQLRQSLERLLESRHVAVPAVRRFVAERVRAVSVQDACDRFVETLRAYLDASPHRAALLDDGPVGLAEFRWLAGDLRQLDRFPVGDHAAVRRLRRRVGEYFTQKSGAESRKQAATRFKDQFAGADAKRRHNAALKAVSGDILPIARAFDVDVNGLLARGFARVLAVAVREYEALLAEHAVLDFPAMLARAVELLSRQEEFAQSRLKLQSRYHHVLVDEFQDTSRLQWTLIRLLIDAWREGEGPAGAAPSIFIVGDRKQSIYRFRHAEVTLMDEAAGFIAALRHDVEPRRAIQHSFRAVPELLAFVNAMAEQMTSTSGVAERFEYRDADRFPVARAAAGARRDGEPVLGLTVAGTIDGSAAAVAGEVERLLSARVTVRDWRGARPIAPDDIAILFRSRAGHRAFEHALEARGIKTYVYKGLGFFDAPEVQDLHALIRYLAQPASDLRAAEFLRSRFVRVSDVTLMRMAPHVAAALGGPDAGTLSAMAAGPADAALLTRVHRDVRRWIDRVDRVPPSDLVDEVLRESAYAFEIGGARLSQARENIKKVRALIRRMQNRGYATMGRLAEYFKTFSAGDESNAVIAAEGRVQLMTIHAAKGLEFPVVFLVRLNAGAGGAVPAISVVPNGPDGEPDVAIVFSTESRKLETQRDAEEARRLLYVAATRARDRLYLGAEVEDGTLKGRRPSLGGLLPQSLRAVLTRATETTDDEVEWKAASGEAFAFRICRPPATSLTAALPAGSAPPVDIDPVMLGEPVRRAVTAELQGDVAGAPDTGRQGDRAADRLVGTLVHRLLRRTSGNEASEDLDQSARTLVTLEERALATPAVLARTVDAYRRLVSRPEVAELLRSGECLYEVPFSVDSPEPPHDVMRGAIDCLVVRPDGSVLLLEFKTGARRDADAEQLTFYRTAVQAMWPDRQIEALLVYA